MNTFRKFKTFVYVSSEKRHMSESSILSSYPETLVIFSSVIFLCRELSKNSCTTLVFPRVTSKHLLLGLDPRHFKAQRVFRVDLSAANQPIGCVFAGSSSSFSNEMYYHQVQHEHPCKVGRQCSSEWWSRGVGWLILVNIRRLSKDSRPTQRSFCHPHP